MKVGQLLREGRARLARTPDADWDARELLLHALEQQHDALVRHLADDVPPEAEQRCLALFERRAQGEPAQYILGEAWFMGLRFSVDARVLIPRQDTELLCETALELAKTRGYATALDLCTGSGALAVSLTGGALMQTAFALSACMAALSVIGNLSERLTTEGLFRLCKRAACWLLGCASTLFLGLMKADALLESGRDALAFRAAEYAVDKLLPVIGKDVSDTLGTIASGTAVIRSAVGVTGTAVMLALCLEPALALICDMLVCRLAAALSEPVAAGPLTRCLKGFADALMILLLVQVSAAALFLILAGVALRGV